MTGDGNFKILPGDDRKTTDCGYTQDKPGHRSPPIETGSYLAYSIKRANKKSALVEALRFSKVGVLLSDECSTQRESGEKRLVKN